MAELTQQKLTYDYEWHSYEALTLTRSDGKEVYLQGEEASTLYDEIRDSPFSLESIIGIYFEFGGD